MHKHHTFAGLFAGLTAASIWGGMYVVSKVVLEVIPPFSLLAIRLVMGALVLGIVILIRDKRAEQKTTLTKEVFWSSFLVGVVGYGISLGFQFVGDETIDCLQRLTGHIGYARVCFVIRALPAG